MDFYESFIKEINCIKKEFSKQNYESSSRLKVNEPLVMKKNYLYRLKEKFSIKKFDSEQPKRVWIFVITLNIIGFLGYFILNSYGINLSK